MIEIEVPATCANLGPGFDCLGIALSLSNIVRLERAERTQIKGCPVEWANEDNLFLRSFRHSCMLLQTSVPKISAEIITGIPPARGLGSSASLAVAGAAAALLLSGKTIKSLRDLAGTVAGTGTEVDDVDLTGGTGTEANLTDCTGTEVDLTNLTSFLHEPANQYFLLRAATDIEGHADNAAPAIYGGFTAAALTEKDIVISQNPAPEHWLFMAFIPDFILETSVARNALPDSYSRQDVVHGISHAALVALAFLKADLNLLSRACSDRIHEPYRRPLIPDFEIVKTACLEQGAKMICISGSGPTIMAIFETSVPNIPKIPIITSSTTKSLNEMLETRIAEKATHNWIALPLNVDNLGIRTRKICTNDLKSHSQNK